MKPYQTQAERLAAIVQRSEELDRLIALKERNMRRNFDTLFKPQQRPSGRLGSLMLNVSTLISIADGALLGYRLFRRFKRFGLK